MSLYLKIEKANMRPNQKGANKIRKNIANWMLQIKEEEEKSAAKIDHKKIFAYTLSLSQTDLWWVSGWVVC